MTGHAHSFGRPEPDGDSPGLEIAGLRIDVLEGAFSWFIRSLDGAVSRDLDRRMAHLEIARGKGKITALLLVDRYPGIRPSQIADVLMRDRPAAGRIIDTLVGAKVIRRECAPDDQRAHALFVTPRGHALADEVRDIVREQERDFFNFIDPEEREQFMGLLRRVYMQMRAGWD
ncbi:MarR family winged helix-turn-helix transcriptional regulator [Falsirhodobacter algicola]|uniref:MarR family transcriptional regulator n=1 Tax=Falsirhodobacter algicola TaxID=2692330 RepID=A0A8J8MTV6_9RHOB|nr:MarR family transcriptional regulator [Falsirhodobacter algicola]QUS36646.1 MarR family transcriptional regulator [Falsirhodobacter algicola]